MLRTLTVPGALATILFCLLLANPVLAENLPHEHQGILIPYNGEPNLPSLSDRDMKRLRQGKVLTKKQLVKDSKRALVVFRVAADSATIWSVIRDFAFYPDWINDIKSTRVYREEDGVIYVRFDAENKYSGPSSWFARHDYPRANEREWGTWTLDYEQRSDLDDSVGYWRVIPVEDEPGQSIVIYSATLKLKAKVPGFIVGIIVKARLKQATVWVKEQSEARMAKLEAER